MFKFYLNNTLVSDPINWKDFTETIERDEVIKGLLPKYEVKLNFEGGGYKYLYDLKQTAGFCNLVELKIEQLKNNHYTTILNGYIFLSDCKFNLNKRTVECDVIDDNFGARIFNNKSIQIYLDSSLSKNSTAITACVTKDVNFFKPSDGTIAGAARRTYPIWEALKYFVEFMSDGLIDFESDYLDYSQTQTDNPQRKLVITTGKILRGVSGSPSPKISFDTLFKNINKKYPIAFTIIKQSNGRPLIKIENEDYFFGTDSGIRIENIEDMMQSINNRLLYSEIGIGGETADYNAAIHSLPDSIRMMFKNESYYYQTECNIDNKLDLVTDFICDSNIIEELVDTNTSNTSYDDSVFFVEVNYSSGISGNTAIKTSIYDSTTLPYYYNAGLTNVIIASNFSIYSDLVQFINSNDIGFLASKTANYTFPYHKLADYSTSLGHLIPLPSSTVLVSFQDDSTSPNHDAGNNFTSNTTYTAPADGHYYFRTNLKLRCETDLVDLFGVPIPPNIMILSYVELRKYSAAAVLLDSYQVVDGTTGYLGYRHFGSPTSYFDVLAEKMFFLEAGEYVEVYFHWVSLPAGTYDGAGNYNGEPTSGRIVILPASTFETITTESSGTLASGSSLDYKVEKIEFDYPIPDDVYDQIKLDMSKSIVVNNSVVEMTTWIRKTTRTISTGITKCEMITNINNSI